MGEPADHRTIFVEYRPRRRRRLAVLAAIGLALLLVVAVYAIRSTGSSPAATVTAYFDALADRDADAARRVLAPEIGAPLGQEAIDDAVLRSEAYSPPREVEVTGVTVDDRDATVAASYVVDGRRYPASLRLRRGGGLVDAVFHRWRIVNGIGTVRFGRAPEQVTVNGEPVAAHDPLGPRILAALPGGYRIGVPEGDPLWQARTTVAVVQPQQETEVDVALAARAEVRDEVDRQIRERLDRCAASTELAPPGCPFAYGFAVAADDVQWRILRYPVVGLSPPPDPERSGAVVDTTREGEAMVTGTRRFGAIEDTVQFPATGMVSVRDGSVRFEPDW